MRLGEFVTRQQFDWIDLPPNFTGALGPGSGPLVARSVQPEWLYFRSAIGSRLRRPHPHLVVDVLLGILTEAQSRRGYRKAAAILCLGSREHEWLRARHPGVADRIRAYRIAPPESERPALRAVAERRPSTRRSRPTRWLWIGRWASHKGNDTLVAWAKDRLSSFPGETLTVAGTGALDMAAAGLVSPQLTIIPSYTRAELPRLLESHDAGVFTSRAEGWGLGLQEMLESGLQVFATEAGATRDLQPYFARHLKGFPPTGEPESPPFDSLEAASYDRDFSWSALAKDYLRQVEGLIPAVTGNPHE